MRISVTERGTFRRCRRMWDYSSHSRQNLTPVIPSARFAVGRCVHETLARWLTEDLDPEVIYLDVAAEELEQTRQAYKTNNGLEISRAELELVADEIKIGQSMVRNYKTYWKSPLPPGFTFVQNEQTAVIKIPDTEHWECAKGHVVRQELSHDVFLCPKCGQQMTWQAVELEMTFDGIIQDTIRDLLYVLERKTYGQRPRLEHLQMNDQFLAYNWGLIQLFPEYEIGGVFYDGLWKREIEKKVGKPRELDSLFLRHKIIRPPEEVDEFQVNLINEAIDMSQNPRIYPNRVWAGCWDCGFERLCAAQSRGEDYEYIRSIDYRKRDTDWRFDEGEE